ncbi:probable protein phosphatase 2C 80 isoform X2 [Durio zibethinus]|uniref:Protein phosphatase n=1 Tax=Durio zibethinus TaxID=66656 RepID=A0A6P5YGI7_DURZI|nr:probable protein phosphatase 2C 80 isoform X2 [Durio zibethinus]
MPVVLLSKLNLVITGKQVRLFNLASSLLRQHKILTANSGFAQFLPYSRNSISDYRFIPNQICNRAKTMAVSGSKAIFGDVYADELVASCGNGLDFLKPSGVYFADRSHSSCQKASVILRKQEQPNNRFLCGYYICDAMLRNTKYNPPFGPRMKVSVICFFGVDFRAIPGEKTLKLLSASYYMPHPAKEETGGEDAHFICANEQAIGVADGVGGWAEVGINAGEFARELMSNSVAAIQDEPKGFIDPARVLEKAHSSTKSQGSSTACIIALTEEGIHAINLGDSGFIVVRDGCTVFHSPVQQHGFNFTYQLESGDNGDLPSSGQVFRIPVLPGDVIVAGTDGLFDNLYNNEVTAVVVHALRAGFSPELMAKQIAALARERAVNRNRQTPFAKAAQDAGFRYYGGKLDDITVVVSYITSSANV